MQIICKSLPEEWTAGGRLSDVSVQEKTTVSGRNREEKERVCVAEECVHVSLGEKGSRGLRADVEKCF